jgi:hypothetical protein
MVSSFALAALAAAQLAAQPPMPPVQPQQPPTMQQPLNLTCVGRGAANKTAYKTIVTDSKVKGADGKPVKGTTTKTVAENYTQDFADQVDVRLFSGDDRIRVPRTMLPDFHGGERGWFKLNSVVADARSVQASTNLGLLNNPKIYIDRVTGIITISGKAGDYSGQCQAVAADAVARF